ncbi:MAG: tRNA (adenosine(37)-N6)-threonylcarbamoyltransferase complex ATPase subunit type 1 TsaE [Bacillota bacterium]
MEKTFTVESLDAMRAFARQVAKHVSPGFVIGLEGDLGAGKTTFTQFLGEALGIRDTINSPTFTIMKIYEEGTVPLYHIDAYRLDGIGADYELEEYIDGDGLCVIEWYSRVEEIMPDSFLAFTIEWTGEEQRRIHMKGSGQYEAIVASLGA